MRENTKIEMIDVVCVKYSRDVSGCGHHKRLRIERKKGGKKKRDKMAARTVEIISFATTGIT